MNYYQYSITDSSLKVIDVPDIFILDIEISLNPNKTEQLGLYKSKNAFYSQCESNGFNYISYFPDYPYIKAIFTTIIIADAKKYPLLLSNGNFTKYGSIPNGKHWFTWEDIKPKSPSDFGLIAGNFESLSEKFSTKSGRIINLTIYSEKVYFQHLQHTIKALKKVMAWDENHYERECLNHFKIVALADIDNETMRSQELHVLNAKPLLASMETKTDRDLLAIEAVIIEEYYYSWMRNPIDNENLKKSLIFFYKQLFLEEQSAIARIELIEKLRSNLSLNDFILRNAEIFRMLQTLLGKTLFDQCLTDLCETDATFNQIITTMEDRSKTDLSSFLPWFSQSETPELFISDEYDADSQNYTLIIKQVGQSDNKPLLIPIKIGLFDAKGNAIKLDFESNEATESVLLLSNAEQFFHFKPIPAKPIPSLLRDFSAPLKLHYNYTMEDLAVLAKYDNDVFNRWDALQKYILHYLLALIETYEPDAEIEISEDFIEVFRSILRNETLDPSLAALMLTLPSFEDIASQMPVILVTTLCQVKKAVELRLSLHLHEQLLKTYLRCNELDTQQPQFIAKEAGIRALKNICLQYLTLMDNVELRSIALAQFKQSINLNMTNTLGALIALSHRDSAPRLQALALFHQKWKHNPDVICTWFQFKRVPIYL